MAESPFVGMLTQSIKLWSYGLTVEVWWCKDRSWSFCFPHLSALTDEEQFLNISYVVHMMTWWHQAGDHNILVTVRVLQSGSLCCASSLTCMLTSMTTQYDQAGWGCQGQGGILWSPGPALNSPCLYTLLSHLLLLVSQQLNGGDPGEVYSIL